MRQVLATLILFLCSIPALAAVPKCPFTNGLEAAIDMSRLPCSIPTQNADLMVSDVNLRNRNQTQVSLTFRNNSKLPHLVIVSYFTGCTSTENNPVQSKMEVKLSENEKKSVAISTDCTYNKAVNLWPKNKSHALIYSNIEVDTDTTEAIMQGTIEISR